MDNTAQTGNQGDLGNKGTTPQPTVQPTPISIPQKEQGPAISTTEVIRSSAEHELPKEVAEAGVEKIPEVHPLPADADKVGVKLAREATPVVTAPTGVVQLPKTEAGAQLGVKTQTNPSNSISWWFILMWRQFKKMHQKLTGK